MYGQVIGIIIKLISKPGYKYYNKIKNIKAGGQ